jgi:hypothetical protein
VVGSLVGWGVFKMLIMVERRIFPVHPYQRTKLNLNELETLVIAATMVVFFTFSSVILLLQNDLL